MSKRSEVAAVLVVAVAWCFVLVSMVEAKGPIWQVYRDGTNRSIPWKTHAANPRFAKWKAGTNGDLSDDLVLDRETGLVWERQPSTTPTDWFNACTDCYEKEVGNLKGWRLPTIEELASLLDNDNVPSLPAGNPFNVGPGRHFWSSTTWADSASYARGVNLTVGDVDAFLKTSAILYSGWCVQGGQGHDTY